MQAVERIEQWPTDRLVPYARNARKHSADQVRRIAGSIERFGFNAPVLASPDGTIIAGHGRVMAAKSIGLESVPVVLVPHLDEGARRAYILADNKLADLAKWDDDLLADEIADLRDLDFDLGDIGFSDMDIARLLPPLEHEVQRSAAEDDEPETVTGDPVSAPGDVWVMGNHRLCCGDATDADAVAGLLAGVKPHLMVTDPPYGVEYDAGWRDGRIGGGGVRATGGVLNDDRADWREAWALFPGDVAYVWHGALHATVVAASLGSAGFEQRGQIVWVKNHIVPSRGHYHWQHEPCIYAVRKGGKGHWHGDRKQTTVWQIDKPRKSETSHSTQKPVECMRRPMVNNSLPGDWVYEPFMGSGTSLVAAETSGRRSAGMELHPPYVDIAIRRWETLTGATAALEATGQSFAEVRADRLGA